MNSTQGTDITTDFYFTSSHSGSGTCQCLEIVALNEVFVFGHMELDTNKVTVYIHGTGMPLLKNNLHMGTQLQVL
jgi:hypothetical protein